MKFVPFTVRVNAAPPAVVDDWESEVIDGTGFSGGGVVVDDDEPPQPESPAIASKGISHAPTCLIPERLLHDSLFRNPDRRLVIRGTPAQALSSGGNYRGKIR